jgi:LCP family protein required for cell wall assembly
VTRPRIAIALALVVVLAANLALAATELRGVVRPHYDDDKLLVVLVLGSDAGLPRSGDPARGRADAIHLIAVDTRRLRATIIDIPRDSYINGDKVNAHMVFGGPERMKDVLSSYSGLKIDHYVLTGFRGLRGLVQGMGGLDVTLQRSVVDSASRANVPAGTTRLRGKPALALARARKAVPGGDFGRTHNQGLILRAAHKQIRQRQNDLGTMTRLLGVFGRNTTTDIPGSDLFQMAQLAVAIKPKNIKQVSLSGSTGFVGAASVVHLNPGSAFSDIRKGRIGR